MSTLNRPDAPPAPLFDNEISTVLNDLRAAYSTLSRKGLIRGILAVDQDAKVLAVDDFIRIWGREYWNIGALAAALYGVSRQGRAFFDAKPLDRAEMIFGDLQFFVKSVGVARTPGGRARELLLAVLADRDVNIGLIVMQMNRFAPRLLQVVEEEPAAGEMMEMSEREVRARILEMKKALLQAPARPAPASAPAPTAAATSGKTSPPGVPSNPKIPAKSPSTVPARRDGPVG